LTGWRPRQDTSLPHRPTSHHSASQVQLLSHPAYALNFTRADEERLRECYSSEAARNFLCSARVDVDLMAASFVSQLRLALDQGKTEERGGGASNKARGPSYVGLSINEDDMALLVQSLSQRLARQSTLSSSLRALAAQRITSYFQSSPRRGYHVTLWHCSRDTAEQLEMLQALKGTSCKLLPRFFAMDQCVAALLVSFAPDSGGEERVGGEEAKIPCIPCFNSHKHVTMWIAKPGMAYLSNHLLASLVTPQGKEHEDACTRAQGALASMPHQLLQDDKLAVMLDAREAPDAEECLHLPTLRARLEFHD